MVNYFDRICKIKVFAENPSVCYYRMAAALRKTVDSPLRKIAFILRVTQSLSKDKNLFNLNFRLLYTYQNFSRPRTFPWLSRQASPSTGKRLHNCFEINRTLRLSSQCQESARRSSTILVIVKNSQETIPAFQHKRKNATSILNWIRQVFSIKASF